MNHDLSKFDAEYEKTQAPEDGDFTPVPDGTYQVKIQTVEVKDTKTPPPRPMLAIEFEILAGPYKGRRLFKNAMIASGDSLQYLKKDLATLGWTGKISELDDIGKRAVLLDRRFEVRNKSRGKDEQGRENFNIYINKALDGKAATASAGVTRTVVKAAANPNSAASRAAEENCPPF